MKTRKKKKMIPKKIRRPQHLRSSRAPSVEPREGSRKCLDGPLWQRRQRPGPPWACDRDPTTDRQ